MEGKFQTSFIPKKPLSPGLTHKPAGRTTSIFVVIAGVIFVTIIALVIVVFGYTLYLQHVNAQYKDDLKTALDNLQPSVIKSLDRTNTRIESAKQLLSQHISPSKIFGFLAISTLKNVRFSNFSYDDSNISKIKITMDGQAKDFSTIALQANEFMKPEYKDLIHDQVFSNLGLDSSGNVAFNFSAILGTRAFLYRPDTAAVPMSVSSTPVQAQTATSGASINQ